MTETDYFTVNIEGREIGVSEGRTQYKKIYRIEVDGVKYKIQSAIEKGQYWDVYLENHPVFKNGLGLKSSNISSIWKWVREDITKVINDSQLNSA